MKHKLISNRFEVFLLIFLCMMISTRLIWLQIDERQTNITSEYYSSYLVFKQTLAPLCRDGVDQAFPLDPSMEFMPLDPGAHISPALMGSFLVLCQIQRLTVNEWLGLSIHLTVFSAFLIALTARVLTSNWVAGTLAAAVYLSRGSLIKLAHTASSTVLMHTLIAGFFLAAALYTRTKDQRLIPALNVILIFCVLVSPLFGLVAWFPLMAMIPYLFIKGRRGGKFLDEFLPGILSTMAAVIVIPSLIYQLHKFIPQSTLPCAAAIRQLLSFFTSPAQLPKLIGSAIAEVELQDFHWQASVSALVLATTWRRFLPSGSGAWSGGLLLLILSSLIIDATLIGEAARQTYDASVIRFYNMATAVASLEPVVIGISAALAWFAVKRLLTFFYSRYET